MRTRLGVVALIGAVTSGLVMLVLAVQGIAGVDDELRGAAARARSGPVDVELTLERRGRCRDAVDGRRRAAEREL
jgi:hypothetical protein